MKNFSIFAAVLICGHYRSLFSFYINSRPKRGITLNELIHCKILDVSSSFFCQCQKYPTSCHQWKSSSLVLTVIFISRVAKAHCVHILQISVDHFHFVVSTFVKLIFGSRVKNAYWVCPCLINLGKSYKYTNFKFFNFKRYSKYSVFKNKL